MKMSLLVLLIVFCLTSCNTSLVDFETDMLKISLDNKGFITSYQDKASSKDYNTKGVSYPLLSLYRDSAFINPSSAQYNAESGILSMNYDNGSVATIKIDPKKSYIRFELQSVELRNDIEAVQWGPISTSLNQWIGETVGIVRDNDFAIGIQALNIFTVEGTPIMPSHKEGKMVIDPLPGQEFPDSLQSEIGKDALVDVNQTGDLPAYVRIYRGNAAIKTAEGSEILFHARDRRKPRVIGKGDKVQYVEAVEQDIVGSAIALFGCPEAKTLDVIEEIELTENLPHPIFDGEWIKRSSRLGEAYLMYDGLSQENALKYAELFGFKLIHIGDFFQSWGHFGLETKRFPTGAEGIKSYADKAKDQGVSLGVHTLTMFTSPHDQYVSPIPNDSLCKVGSSKLSKAIGVDDDVIYVDDATYFKNRGNTQTIKIGKELIRYARVVDEAPYRLEGCTRGQYDTKISSHEAGTVVDKLANNVYAGFYPNFELQDAFAKRLAEVCNETGIDLMDFDGFDLNATGHDAYADAKFADTWYKHLDRPRLVCGSQPSHYYWHIYSFMNWGEPWYNALRQSQVNYRIENQRFFERNLMPGMLGWFSYHGDYRLEDIEWIQARSAAFNAGFLLRVDENIEKNGFLNEISEAVREWQKARRSNAFSKELIEEMKDPKKEYHLEKVSDNSWNISPVTFAQNVAEFKYRQVQTGEPIVTRSEFNNPYNEQDIQFYLFAHAQQGNTTATIDKFTIELNNSQALEINHLIKAEDRIYCDGKKIYLCDKQWKVIKELESKFFPQWQSGKNTIKLNGNITNESAPRISLDFKVIGKGIKINSTNL